MRAQELQRPIRSELYTSDLFKNEKLNRNDKKKKRSNEMRRAVNDQIKD